MTSRESHEPSSSRRDGRTFPTAPTWPGLDLFAGPVLHSTAYRNPQPFRGLRTLVVGFGNSGGEIALDLAEAGVDVTLSVRGPVSILPRELLGLPILTWAIAEQRLPAAVADFINAPAIALAVGSYRRLGLTRASKGPRRLIEEDGRVPLIDVGTLEGIRAGRIKVRGDIERFTATKVVFKSSPPETFGAVILATGFRPDLRGLLPDAVGVLSPSGAPIDERPTHSGTGPLFLRRDRFADGTTARNWHRSREDCCLPHWVAAKKPIGGSVTSPNR